MIGKTLIVRVFLIIALVPIVMLIMGLVDYHRVTENYQKPLFAQLDPSSGTDEYGSGTYRGIGYTIEIEGYFPKESPLPLRGPVTGVDSATFYVFGKAICFVERKAIS